MRSYNKRQKQFLFSLHDGKCAICGDALKKGWHADHIIPYSKGGETILSNGQALCPECNLSKSNKMIKLRKWQDEALNEFKQSEEKSFFTVAGVASGKTFWGCYATKQLFKEKGYNSVVVISNTVNISENWCKSFLKLGLDIDYRYGYKYHWGGTFDGISVTYQSLNPANCGHLLRLVNDKTVLIIDEVHHAAEDKTWGEGIKSIGEKCGKVILLSGTPTRSDKSRIPFVRYNYRPSEGVYELESDYNYTYAQSVYDKVACPVQFHKIAGKGSYSIFYNEVVEINETLPEDEAKDNLKALLRDPSCQYSFKIFEQANIKLQEIRERRNANYAGLIVCQGVEEAERLTEMINTKYGEGFAVVTHHGLTNSNEIIEGFKDSDAQWIVSIGQVSEGVDIPRIRVITYANMITTDLFFTQVVGRGLRNPVHEINDRDTCHVFIPEWSPLVQLAEQMEEQIKHIVDDNAYCPDDKGDETRHKKPRKLIIFDELEDVEVEMTGNIVGGQIFESDEVSDIEKKSKLFDTTPETFMQILSYAKKGLNLTEDKNDQKPLREKIDEMRKAIKRKVGKYYHLKNGEMDYSQIQYMINASQGVKSREQMNLNQLIAAERVITEMINREQ